MTVQDEAWAQNIYKQAAGNSLSSPKQAAHLQASA